MTTDARLVLPSVPNELIGRERELAQVQQILNWPSVSLLTFTGPGGVGKTRLALEVARRLAPRFQGGAVFVPLAALERPEQVLAAVARALGLQESERNLTEVVGEHLASRSLLLVLDNFEHVLPAAADLASLLSAASNTTMLVTSRERLRLYGEHEFPVPPLSLPTPQEPGGEAARLFVERARAVRPDFALTDASRPLVEALCRRLDGLPLAIELAAARTRSLSLPALLDRMGRRLDLLTQGPRDLPARQQTLRAAIDWSYALLDEGEQRLLARLAVFVGGWTLEAAEAVCAEDLDVLSGLASLVDKSLVQADATETETRYRMLETVREYALEQLRGRDDEVRVRRAHASYFFAVGASISSTLLGFGPEDIRELAASHRRLSDEQPNLLAAMHFAARTRDVDALSAVAWDLMPMWATLLDFTVVPVVRDALAAVPPDSAAAGWLWYDLAFQAFRRGLFDECRASARAGLAVFEALGDARGQAYAFQILGYCHGTFDEAAAQRDLERSLAWARPHRDTLLAALCLNFQAWLALRAGRRAEARAAQDEALQFMEGVHNHISRAWTQLYFGAIELGDGRPDLAEAHLRSVLHVGGQLYVVALQIGGLWGMGALAAQRGQGALALKLWAAAESLKAAHNARSQVEGEPFLPWLAALIERQHEPDLARAVQEGQAVDAAELVRDLAEHGLREDDAGSGARRAPTTFALTPRERQVLALLSRGLSNKQIAAELGTGLYTVNDQVSAVFSKLGVRSRTAAARYALEHGLT